MLTFYVWNITAECLLFMTEKALPITDLTKTNFTPVRPIIFGYELILQLSTLVTKQRNFQTKHLPFYPFCLCCRVLVSLSFSIDELFHASLPIFIDYQETSRKD